MKEEVETTDEVTYHLDICPECGEEALVKVGHCATCQVCGYSLCSL